MRAPKTSLIASSLIALTTRATAQLSTICQGQVCFSLNIPANTASSGNGDIFFRISAPSSYDYVALGQGKGMVGSNMFIVYTAAGGKNVTLSPRTARAYTMPTFNSNAQATLLEGSGVSDGKMIANVKCSNCASFSGADFKAGQGNWIYAAQTSGGPKNSNDKNAPIQQHNNYGPFQWNYADAKGGNSVNPLLETSTTKPGNEGAGTPTCIPRPVSTKGSPSASTSTGEETGGDDGDGDGNRGGLGGQPTRFGGWPSGAPTGAPWNGGKSRRQDLPYCDEGPSLLPVGLSAERTKMRNMLIAHGTLAALAFVILFPAGAIAIRLASFPGLLWVHGAWQVFAYIVYSAAFGLGIYIARRMNLLDNSHPIIGIVLFALLFFMPMLGYLHHVFFKKTGGRTLWSHAHLWIGRAAITLGIINGGLGLKLADENGMSSKGGMIAYAVVAGIIWVVWMAASILGERRRKTRGRAEPPKYTDDSRTSDTALRDLQGQPENGHYAPKQELIAWLNNLLQLNITKVEQCGTGAALCQVYDSIFYDVPMSRVKFNANTEYAYLQNFKILQNVFTRHNIDRPIPVEQLVKCKMQDNLEFLQWTKRYWDQYFPGHDYDPVERRKGQGGITGGPPASTRPAASAARRAPAANTSAAPRTRTPLGAGGAAGGAASAALREENNVLKETVAGLERERDFYFSKLRDIELLIQGAMDADPELEKQEDSLLKQIQTILYSTEEGFEIPAEGEQEEETF
ncbi:uncharacterized protein EI97DRAFT_458823 [Westerdykella ornata]|uniref:EB1 C-terminal domain-containing protein n=1 Tax=Westerdykella ornata TaxID=318751 RepID=A0A6A6JLL8_WESOR|nr:uncharacterized protein EI97DRAFT_458823 [Westerdykella ornata]KAF2275809.1 hypothetical protein EI97DRAFT_458823 [Westerdykella ornata]